MRIGNTIEATVQQVMSLKTPEVLAILPGIEAMPRDERIALVQRGFDTTDTLIKNWDKMADIFAARGESKAQIKRRARDLKEARKRLDQALRLMNPKFIPPAFRATCEACFNVLAGWFVAHQDDLAAFYALPKVRRADIPLIMSGAVAAEAESAKPTLTVDHLNGVDMIDREIVVQGPSTARVMNESELEDILDVSNNSSVH